MCICIGLIPQQEITDSHVAEQGISVSGSSLGTSPSAAGTRISVGRNFLSPIYEESSMNSEFPNGVSRRNFMRILGAASAAATSFPAFAVAQQQRRGQGGGGDDMGERMARPADAVIISSNENPLGMSNSALE